MLVYHSERERARKEAGLDGFKFEEKLNVKDTYLTGKVFE